MLHRIFLVSWILLLTLLTSNLLADSVEASSDTLLINGVRVIRFSAPEGSMSPVERATQVATRLKGLPYWGAIEVGGDGATRSLLIGQEVILTVSQDDAAKSGTTVSLLAKTWASKLQDALNLPPLRVSDNFARLPVGKTQLIVVTGSEAQLAVASSADPRVARVTKEPRGFVIVAVNPGSTIVSISAGKSQENVNVTVQPYAVDLPQNLEVEVTGNPASSDVVKGAIDYALKTMLKQLPDAVVRFSAPPAKPLDDGASTSYSVPVDSTSPSGIPKTGLAHVTVRNRAVESGPANFLWYSNNPETVKQSQSLFSASLKKDAKIRLLYHHMNGTMQDIYLRVEVVNESKKEATLAITYGDSKPSINPVVAGYSAATQFLHHWASGGGDVVKIPPGEVMPLSLRRLSPGETSSGLCELQLLSGPSELLVRTDSLPPLRLDDKWANTIFTSTPWHEVGCHPLNDYDNIPCEANPHVYADPHVNAGLTYVVGGRHGYYRIGQQPLSQVNEEGSLDGNFGVLDTIETKLSNPNSFPADIEIVFEASAGYAGGIFLIEKGFYSTGILKPKESRRIARIHLQPGATRSFKIMTLPISGGSYPATLTARVILPPK